MKKLSVKERFRVKKYAVSKLRLNGYFKLNDKNVVSNKMNDIFEFYKNIFGRDPYYDLKAVNKEENKRERNLVIKQKLNNVTDSEFVYVIGNLTHNICKIGYSKNPLSRIKEIQTGCPYKLQLFLVVGGNRTTESQLQKKYKRYKSNGEWFHYREELKHAVESIAKTDKNLASKF